ncbi:hypothetical protein IGI04_002442 [Brassica rapa subsp. trilocularis]|uniref:RNase H type-1 domain-containing protein n=1 Tax=Brassica rapa subsp. trilocularis TaxID=1813537 RepID=A0ABQ7NVK8_BRACM|nr:hypothetical protein IGI04_002442 [Brassica rapa subsp. trilocularis]
MDFLFWRKNSIIEPELDRDPYPWIIWYIWKARNDKLFRGIDRDPLELVRHAESECKAWFDANELVQPVVQDNNPVATQVISLGNICLLNGSWTSSAQFSGCGWVWMDSNGNTQLMGTRNFTRRESALHSEVEALRWAMENMLQHSTCQSFGTDCKELIAMIKDPQAWPSYATELERIETLQICFPDTFRGTVLHIPPEYLSTDQSSEKNDVLRFGILLLELKQEKELSIGARKRGSRITILKAFRTWENPRYVLIDLDPATRRSRETMVVSRKRMKLYHESLIWE